MMTIEPDLVFALGGAVMHFLWQGALIGWCLTTPS